jgi:hypothetical protein
MSGSLASLEYVGKGMARALAASVYHTRSGERGLDAFQLGEPNYA